MPVPGSLPLLSLFAAHGQGGLPLVGRHQANVVGSEEVAFADLRRLVRQRGAPVCRSALRESILWWKLKLQLA